MKLILINDFQYNIKDDDFFTLKEKFMKVENHSNNDDVLRTEIRNDYNEYLEYIKEHYRVKLVCLGKFKSII